MLKVALITGASRGIGREITFALAIDHDLVLIATSKDSLEKLAQEIIIKYQLPESRRPLVIVADVSNKEQVSAAVEYVIEQKGHIDVLFNNAGIFEAGTLTVSQERLIRTINVNLVGAINFVCAVAPHMKKQNCGHIFNVASRAGKYARPFGGIYAASKFGLIGFNEALYQELAEHGIKVTAICPGPVNTPMASNSGISEQNRIKLSDLSKTVRYLISLSSAASIKKILIDCHDDVIRSQQRSAVINNSSIIEKPPQSSFIGLPIRCNL
jgi:NAD(P)-dependent dehydrogenase (short-subunit alcohol dehydrogenase family)